MIKYKIKVFEQIFTKKLQYSVKWITQYQTNLYVMCIYNVMRIICASNMDISHLTDC